MVEDTGGSLYHVSANERVHSLDAVANGLRRRSVAEADVLPVAGDAPSEVDVGEHGYAGFGEQTLAQDLGIGAAGDPAGFGDVGPGVERAAGRAARDARHVVQQADDQVAPL